MAEPAVKVGDIGEAPVIPLLLLGIGAYLAWFGVHYWRRDITWPSDPVKSVLRGHGLPARGAVVTSANILTSVEQHTGATNAAGGSGNIPVSDSRIAQAALEGKGHCYIYGGAPGGDGKGCWDCSSFVSYTLSRKLGLAIPGYGPGGYDGSIHGPTTLSYLAWSGADTIGHTPDVARAGDLCVWQTHMGVALGNGQMISALSESLGTLVTPINGQISGELLYVRRISGQKPKPSGGGSGGGSGTEWWIFAAKDGSNFYVAEASSLTAAQQQATSAGDVVYGGPFPTKAAAQSALP